MTLCNLCPRGCDVCRASRAGFCKMPENPVIARAAPHFWEEPCISGTKGSGAVFFGGCNLRCVFCQNEEISRGGFGKEVAPSELRQIFFRLIEKGVHNINLVTPTHFANGILAALEGGLPVPVIYNCGGYESVRTLQKFEGKIQVYLPDLKYSDGEAAEKYSGAPDYPETAKAALLEMFRQTGPCRFDENGMLLSGLLIRHLILPSNLKNTFGVIDWVADTFPKGEVLFSLMSQYTPPGGLSGFQEISRRVSRREYEKACEYLFSKGVEDGFVQELSSASREYLPDFDLSGVE